MLALQRKGSIMQSIHVRNEIGKLGCVLLHRPGAETQQLPHGDFGRVFYLRPTRSQFNLCEALEEYNRLSTVLSGQGVEILVLTDLLHETLENAEEARSDLINGVLSDSRIVGNEFKQGVRNYLESSVTNDELIDRILHGIRYGDIGLVLPRSASLTSFTNESFDPDTFLINPLNTAFFTRDPMSIAGHSLVFSHMYWPDRNPEVGLLQTISRFHPRFKDAPSWDGRASSFHIEGGDVIDLDEHSLLVGISSRTEAGAIDSLAKELFWQIPDSGIHTVYAIPVPSEGSRLHLDAYLTRIDVDSFIIDPTLMRPTSIYQLQPGKQIGSLRVKLASDNLKSFLEHVLGTGGLRIFDFRADPGSRLHQELENGAASALCLSPGVICTCEENVLTNDILSKAGIEVHPIPTHEMVAGFGGPSSLCLPLVRESL